MTIEANKKTMPTTITEYVQNIYFEKPIFLIPSVNNPWQ